MVENKENLSNSEAQFLEVYCRGSGKIRRFAAGTEAGFALNVINAKLDLGATPALLIEAAKEGEEPVNFGPNSVLVFYGEGWRLQTVLGDDCEIRKVDSTVTQLPFEVKPALLHSGEKSSSSLRSDDSVLYLGKIILAFCFMFALGGIFTLFLENLPGLLLYINSSV
ncbi:hypothetical protein AMTRI_Chr03g55880 [Amborella trichopoda]|uniref:uncharacterized protein LOC105420800 n=1 Tax=Amborella trichopoda TaxID=13333 RepID=UPI0005D2DCEC|nr:uncharacterized protein LOC105420800 [Amborella trichopoda]|eukprot:XP_011624220.1 uncharacterized protein LOC105420800 [Amborella trichopoda]